MAIQSNLPHPVFGEMLLKLRQTRIESIQRQWPELLSELSIAASDNAKPQQVSPKITQEKPLPQESYERLHTLMMGLGALPPGAIAIDQHRTFETLLSDWLGFSVICQPRGDVPPIPYHIGRIRGLPYPAGFDRNQVFVPEAANSRHSLSWLENSSQQHADYLLYLHPNFLLQQPGGVTAKPWFVGKKAVVIDPSTLDAVVTLMADVLPEQLNRYQFGITPGALRQSRWWQPGASGAVTVFYTAEDVPVGSTFIGRKG